MDEKTLKEIIDEILEEAGLDVAEIPAKSVWHLDK